MDAVKSFNAELSSLYEVKPPISKAKMTALTRGAIKAIKFYKHVVQSVEKFILKCKPEYKVPGLYVIDSIVRQSRHQFGSDKDVFAPRFAKNMQQTFVNLFKCPPEDKSKVIRVLNLWQKNQVFAPDVIQPLFDLADPNHPIHKEISAAMQNNGMAGQGAIVKGSPALQKTPTKAAATADPGALAQLGSIANNPSSLDPNTLAQLQQLHRLLLRQTDGTSKPEGPPVHFDRKLLDFDYGSDEEDDPTNPSPKPPNPIESVGNLLSNPEVLRQLQTLQQTMMNNTNLHPELDLEKLRKLQEMKQQEDEFDKHLAQTVPNLPFASEIEFKPSNTNSPAVMSNFFLPADLSQPPPGYKPSQQYDMLPIDDIAMESEVEFISANDNDIEVIDIDHGDSRSPSRERYRRRRSRSKERSRDRNRDRRRRSRSRSRSRSRRHRTRSRERERKRERKGGEEEEKDKEKEKERKKRGLPPVKKENLSVCSTTLWVGHLSKLVHQEDLSDTFGEFGEIVSIDLIIPRGCAFIVMHRRQDAARCLTKLKNHKMQGKAITLAWAPGKGVKGKELKDYWEGDLGVSYIPFMKLKADMDFEMLEDGGMIDEDTLPIWLKEKVNQVSIKKEDNPGLFQLPEAPPSVDTSQPPPAPNAGLLQPPPPMTLPLVSPFQLNNRLLGMPPGMMPNVPMGVPPPNLQGAILPNQLLGISSPFGQGLLHTPLASIPPPMDKNPSASEGMPPSLPESMIPFSLLPPQPPPLTMALPHEDNMDVEMEDAEKPSTNKNSNSDSSNNFNGGKDSSSSSRFSRHDDDRRDRNKSRDRDRERGRGRRSSRDRRDRDHDRESSRGDRRERNNRWGDRRDSRESNRDDRRDREKALNDRLREMAGDNTFREEKEHPPPLLERPPMFNFNTPEPLLDKPPERFGGRRRHEFEGPPLDFEPPPPRDFDGPPPRDFDGPPRDFDGPPPRDFDGPPPRDFDGPPPREFDGPPPREFEGPPPRDFDGPPRDFDGPPPREFERPVSRGFEPPPPRDFEGPPAIPREFDVPVPRDFEGPPVPFDGPGPRDFDIPMPRDFDGPRDFDVPLPLDFNGPPMDFDGPPRDFDMMPRPMMHPRDMRPGDRFDDRRRGPPEFFPPRDGFGPRGRFRGPGPDGFPPRGPPMLRPPHMFHPRGPHMRGPRPGPPWMEGGPMRPNFPPRFDGPPDFFRGPPGPPGGPPFEEPPHVRHRRHEERRRFRPEFDQEEEQQQQQQPPPQEFERPERRSRWGNSSPQDDNIKSDPIDESSEIVQDMIVEAEDVREERLHHESENRHTKQEEIVELEPSVEEPVKGNTTPLHDEPEERRMSQSSAPVDKSSNDENCSELPTDGEES